MNTQELCDAFRTWNGNAFIRSHLDWLKTTYQGNQLLKQRAIMLPEDNKPKVKVAKQVPHRNMEKAERRYMVGKYGRRQAIKLFKDARLGIGS